MGGGPSCEGCLQELHVCNTAPCPSPDTPCRFSEWEAWSECGGGCMGPNQRERKRAIAQFADGGTECRGNLEETQTCGFTKVPCNVSAWTEWDDCDLTCGGGQQHRQRQIHTFPKNGGTECPSELMETQGCNTSPCRHGCELGEWREWGSCSARCGEGQHERSREVLQGHDCTADLSETAPCSASNSSEPCGTPCRWGDWSTWSGCSCSCGGGQMTRNRHIIEPPRGDGAPCQPQDKEVVQPCNTQPCSTGGTCQNGKWGVWADWSPCSVTCGGGTTFRNRKIVQMANACGRPVTGKDRESMFCMTMPCAPAVNCEFSSWGAWSDCSGSCNGIKTRERGIGKYGQGNGSYCEGALKQTFPCNVISSKPDGPAVDCEIGEWEPWTKCTQPCGSEQKMRHRKILHLAENGGLSCDGDLSVVQGCGGPCPGPTPCLLGEWGEWGACSKCGGQKKRFKSISQYPSHGGKDCELGATEETADCPRECHTKRYCSWNDWTDWGLCTSTCGHGKRSRRRYLRWNEANSTPPVAKADRKYATLYEGRKASKNQQFLSAFTCGCLSFVVGFAILRASTILRSRPHAASTENEWGGEPARAGHSLQETELPLIMNDGDANE